MIGVCKPFELGEQGGEDFLLLRTKVCFLEEEDLYMTVFNDMQ